MKTIKTIGHSNKTFTEFLTKLQEYKIDVLVDIRTFPRSRFYPHFNKTQLSELLAREGISYLFRGKNLGGRGHNTNYDEAIDELIYRTNKEGLNVCIMCSEKDYKRCHRHQMIEPSLKEKGMGVTHIQYDK